MPSVTMAACSVGVLVPEPAKRPNAWPRLRPRRKTLRTPKLTLKQRHDQLMQLLREMPKASRLKVIAQVRAIAGRAGAEEALTPPSPHSKKLRAMPTDPTLPPLEEPILPEGLHLCGGLKRHYRVSPESPPLASPSEPAAKSGTGANGANGA